MTHKIANKIVHAFYNYQHIIEKDQINLIESSQNSPEGVGTRTATEGSALTLVFPSIGRISRTAAAPFFLQFICTSTTNQAAGHRISDQNLQLR